MLQYQSRAIGTREEIIQALRRRASANGNCRREEAEQAIHELRTGATLVKARSFEFVVIGEPLKYVVELSDGSREEVTARSNTEAWGLAYKLAHNKRLALECVHGESTHAALRVTRLYRDVTRDEI